MKYLVVVFLVVCSTYVQAQKACESSRSSFSNIFTIVNADRFSSSITVKGEKANLLMKALLGETNDRKQVHHLNKYSVPGINSPIKMKIIEVVHGFDEATCHTYFHLYKNKKEKKSILKELKDTEKDGIAIYFKIDKSDVISLNNLNTLLIHFKRLVI